MTLSAFDRGLGRACHTIGAALVLLLIAAGSYAGGRFTNEDQWPYHVADRRLVAERVAPGDQIGMRRLVEYHEEDCWRQYDRRAVSRVQSGEKPGMVARFDAVVDQRLPVDLSGKWQTWTDRLPEDFTCGPAYLAETVTAACTWWQRNVRLLRKPDIITPFMVSCPLRAD